ncbi:MAG: hypothetical protein HY075_10535, partial [Deltaproteobacteria bacterium]|nr:hypothetical protein [Deltaproteobacteria bacterium]
FVTLLSFWVTFPQREDLVAKKGWDLPPKIVTLGPYTVTKWEKGKQIVFERNASYYGAKPRVEHVVALIEPVNETARKLFFDGKIDALLNVTAEDLVDFTPDSGKQLRQFEYLATVFLAFNAAHRPTASAELRRAIAQVLDRSGLQAALKGGQSPADSLIPKGIAGYEPMSMPVSIDQAKLALLAAGYKSAADVPPLSVLCIEGRLTPVAEYVRSQLSRGLDLKVDLKCVAPAEYAKLRKAGKFQMVIAQWGADYPDASSFMEIFLSDAESNYTGWRNPRYDRLVNVAGGTLTVLERLKTYSEAQRILLQDDAVIVPLYYPKITALLSASVSEFEINALNYLFFKRIGLK